MSSFFDDASLVMIPSGFKDGKVYSVKPTSGAGDLTFTRNSNATRVDANGLIEKARANLLLYSNQFNNWNIVSVSLTGGQSGYDGSSDAWLFDSSSGYIRNNLTLSGVYTYSIYAKQGTADGIRLRMDGGTDANVYISLTDGSESLPTNGIAYTATSVGGGWWRISVTANDSAFTNFRVYAIDGSGGSTTGTIYIQDAQLEQGLVATDYIETTTTAMSEFAGVTASSVADVPRLDYSGGATCPSLLLEPQRTNLATYSEQLNMGTGGTSSVTANSVVSPDGYTNGDTIGIGYLSKSVSATAGTYTMSVFLKYQSSNAILLYIYDGAYYQGSFNPSTGVATSITGSPTVSMEDYGNGWWRCFVTVTTANNISEIGFGSGNVYAYGLSLEAGSYGTSYIPTQNSAVTRLADSCSKTGISSLIGQTEGTIFWDMEYADPDRYLSIANATGSSSDYLLLWHTSDIPRVALRGSGTNAVVNTISSYPSAVNTRYKYAISWTSGGNFYVYRNGTQIFSTTIGTLTLSSPFDAIKFADRDDSPLFEGKIYQTLSFTSALNSNQLAELTA